MDRLWMMTLPVATNAAPASTTNKLDNPRVNIAAPASTTTKLNNRLSPLPVKLAEPASTTTKLDGLYAKVAVLGNTTT
jgi:hypothetical protein